MNKNKCPEGKEECLKDCPSWNVCKQPVSADDFSSGATWNDLCHQMKYAKNHGHGLLVRR